MRFQEDDNAPKYISLVIILVTVILYLNGGTIFS